LGRLVGTNPNAPILIECFDWDKDGSSDFIGSFKATLNELKHQKSFELINAEKKAKHKKYVNSGNLNIVNIQEVRVPSFLDYVTTGTEISLIVAIDYTASNGQPTSPDSLHYFNPNGPNEYMQAIRIVGDVVAPYDSDGLIPAYGFGAKLTDGSVSHCFHVTGGPDPNCQGITGVLYAYQNSFNFATLYGPTNFSPLIHQVINIAKQPPVGAKYYVLLIITDGEITDMSATVQALKEANKYPISVIIVGVGNADFTSMNQLDDDTGTLFTRDIVQFVPFRNYRNRPLEELSKDTLAEVPKQLVQFMTSIKVMPKYSQ
jgi:hypothetical protein